MYIASVYPQYRLWPLSLPIMFVFYEYMTWNDPVNTEKNDTFRAYYYTNMLN